MQILVLVVVVASRTLHERREGMRHPVQERATQDPTCNGGMWGTHREEQKKTQDPPSEIEGGAPGESGRYSSARASKGEMWAARWEGRRQAARQTAAITDAAAAKMEGSRAGTWKRMDCMAWPIA
jgi:hypothetical protein